MAYCSQETKAKLAPAIKAVLKKYGMKGTISVKNHSTLCVTIKSGKLDIVSNYNSIAANKPRQGWQEFKPAVALDVNQYWYSTQFSGDCLDFVSELIAAMKGPDYFDESDSMTDYFHCSHYMDCRIGTWDTPYSVC